MTAFAVRALFAFAWGPAGGLTWAAVLAVRYRRRYLADFTGSWLAVCAGGVFAGLTGRDWAWLAGSAASFLAALAAWWRRRGKRRGAAALIGAASRAARDALVRRARDAARPRQVLRPAPGGVR